MEDPVKKMGPSPRSQERWSLASIAGAALAALLASLCCIGPLLFAALGIAGASILVKLERYRALSTIAMLLGLGAGFYFSYRKPKPAARDDGCGCELPPGRRSGRALLWIGAVLVIGIWSFPYLADGFLG